MADQLATSFASLAVADEAAAPPPQSAALVLDLHFVEVMAKQRSLPPLKCWGVPDLVAAMETTLAGRLGEGAKVVIPPELRHAADSALPGERLGSGWEASSDPPTQSSKEMAAAAAAAAAPSPSRSSGGRRGGDDGSTKRRLHRQLEATGFAMHLSPNKTARKADGQMQQGATDIDVTTVLFHCAGAFEKEAAAAAGDDGRRPRHIILAGPDSDYRPAIKYILERGPPNVHFWVCGDSDTMQRSYSEWLEQMPRASVLSLRAIAGFLHRVAGKQIVDYQRCLPRGPAEAVDHAITSKVLPELGRALMAAAASRAKAAAAAAAAAVAAAAAAGAAGTGGASPNGDDDQQDGDIKKDEDIIIGSGSGGGGGGNKGADGNKDMCVVLNLSSNFSLESRHMHAVVGLVAQLDAPARQTLSEVWVHHTGIDGTAGSALAQLVDAC
eukprot:g5500.t1